MGRVTALALVALMAGCYGFAGGGLPPNVRTVAILPFDNQTVEPALTQEVAEAVRIALEERLGLRPAAAEDADAIVSGSIVGFRTDVPINFQGDGQGQVQVTRRELELVVNVEIFDRNADAVLWQQSGLRVRGEYEPPNEAEGRTIALEILVNDIVEGAQSQW